MTGQRDYYTTSCILDCNYFNKYYKMIAIDLSKQALDTKAIQQINFIRNLNGGLKVNENTTIFFITGEVKVTILDFSHISVQNDSI